MPTYFTPGLYFEPADKTTPGLTAIRTDIAAFIGLAEQGPLHQPTPVTSWEQFGSVFGSFVAWSYLAYSVKAFFDNGGQKCYIVRVAAPSVAPASVILLDRKSRPTLKLKAA